MTGGSFLITSPGYTATKWLAWALNLHPLIYCNHSAGSDALERDYSLDELAQLVEDKVKHRDAAPVAVFLSEQRQRAQGAALIGNVHRYSLTALQRNRVRFGPADGVKVVNLVRHPVPWVESGAAMLRSMSAGGVALKAAQVTRHVSRYRALYRALGVTGEPSWRLRCFAFQCARLPQLARESRSSEVSHWPMERLTVSSAVFAELFDAVAAGAARADPAYLEQVFDRSPIHTHRARPATSGDEQYAAWTDVERAIFDYWAVRSELAANYQRFDYSIPGGSAMAGRDRAAHGPQPRSVEGEISMPRAMVVHGSADVGDAEKLNRILGERGVKSHAVDMDAHPVADLAGKVQNPKEARFIIFLLSAHSRQAATLGLIEHACECAKDAIVWRRDVNLNLPSCDGARLPVLVDSPHPVAATAQQITLAISRLARQRGGVAGGALDAPLQGPGIEGLDPIRLRTEDGEIITLPAYIEEQIQRPYSPAQVRWWKQVHKFTTKVFSSAKEAQLEFGLLCREQGRDSEREDRVYSLLTSLHMTVDADVKQLTRQRAPASLAPDSMSLHVLCHLSLCLRVLSGSIERIADADERRKSTRLSTLVWTWLVSLNMIADSVIDDYLTGLDVETHSRQQGVPA